MACFNETETNTSISEIFLRNIDEKINIIVEKEHQVSLTFFVWGYHVYMNVWALKSGDENLY